MQSDRRGFLVVLMGLGGCSMAPSETARLPEFNNLLSIDPVRYSIEQGADTLSNPRRLTGQPWEAALLVQALEFLAVELPTGPRWNVVLPMSSITLPAARAEWRQAFGIALDARAQEVIDSLSALRNAYAARSPAAAAAALRPPLFSPGGQESLNRFADPPALPRTTRALLDARQELASQNNDRRAGQGFVMPLARGAKMPPMGDAILVV
jgi:hypothetical protein